LTEHRPAIRVAYNSSTFALSAGAAGAMTALVPEHGVGSLVARVAVCSATNYLVNMGLTTVAVSASSDKRFWPSVRSNVRWTIMPFTLMASAALILVVLWQRSPVLSVVLIGPLLAIALYQRSTIRALRAIRLSLTDPLTGLGNHRHFHERLQRELLDAQEHG